MEFGSYIKEIRNEKGLSLRELSKRSGISHPYLSQLENGKNKNPSPDIIEKLSKGLGVDFHGLWLTFSKSVQGQYLKEQKEARAKEMGELLQKAMEDESLFDITIPVKVPSRIEYPIKDNKYINKITKETDLFDLFYLLNMDTDLHYKDKLLSDEDKKFILQVLDRSLTK